MIVPDVNLLLFAHDSTAPKHAAARSWWEGALSGSEPVGIPWVVVMGFVRLATHPTLSENPMTVSQARRQVEQWFQCPQLRLLNPTPRTMTRFFDLLEEAGTGGNLCTDALIAASAEEHAGVVYSTDADFARFTNITWRNPLGP